MVLKEINERRIAQPEADLVVVVAIVVINVSGVVAIVELQRMASRLNIS